MNIFYLSPNTRDCAQMHCDEHVLKMVVEYAQLLSTAHRVLDGEFSYELSDKGRKKRVYTLPDDREHSLYKLSHENHPCSMWVRESQFNYVWLWTLYRDICEEYRFRYGRANKAESLLYLLEAIPTNIPMDRNFSEPPICMKQFPECIVDGDVETSYHNFYRDVKSRFAHYRKGRPAPTFMLGALFDLTDSDLTDMSDLL